MFQMMYDAKSEDLNESKHFQHFAIANWYKLFPNLNVNLTFWHNKNGKCHSMYSVETHAPANFNPIDE